MQRNITTNCMEQSPSWKTTVPCLVDNFFALFGRPWFIIVTTPSCNYTPSNQSSLIFRHILISSFCLNLQIAPPDFLTKIQAYKFFISTRHATFPAHIISPDIIIQLIMVKNRDCEASHCTCK